MGINFSGTGFDSRRTGFWRCCRYVGGDCKDIIRRIFGIIHCIGRDARLAW